MRNKYGQLELLRYARSGGKGKGAIWLALCSCGRTTEVVVRWVRAGRIRTCGKCNKGPVSLDKSVPVIRLLDGIPSRHRNQFRAILKRLDAVGRAGELDPDKYVELIGKRCVGCGTRETLVELGNEPHTRGTHNHTQLIPICTRCNHHRNGTNTVEWLEHVMQVARSLQARAGE